MRPTEDTDPAARPPCPPRTGSDRPDVRVADAVPRNWVDDRAPRALRPFLRLSRVDRPAGTWLLLLPCWWGLGLAVAWRGDGFGLYDLWLGLACAVGAFLMRGAGCTWNDVTDRDIDGGVARTRSRPLPSGQVTLRGALAWMVAQALVAFAILLTFPAPAIWLGVAALVPVCIYPFMKRVTWWPQVFLGIAFNWGALLLWAAATEGLAWPAVALWATGLVWTLFYDTVYACQDKEDDALIGVKSTARLFGDRAARWLLGFLVVTVALATLAAVGATAGAGPWAAAAALAGVWAFGWRLHWQLRRFAHDDPAVCLTLFRDARTAGLLMAAGCLAAGALSGLS